MTKISRPGKHDGGEPFCYITFVRRIYFQLHVHCASIYDVVFQLFLAIDNLLAGSEPRIYTDRGPRNLRNRALFAKPQTTLGLEIQRYIMK